MGQASCKTSPFIPFHQHAWKQPSQIYRIEVAQSVLHVPRASRFCPWFCTCVAWQQSPTSHHCFCSSLWGGEQTKNIISVNWSSQLSWIGGVCVRRQPHSHGIQDIGGGSGESLLCRKRFQDVLHKIEVHINWSFLELCRGFLRFTCRVILGEASPLRYVPSLKYSKTERINNRAK